MKKHKAEISLIVMVILLLQPVINLSAGGQSDVNVNIPFDQIYGLIDALQEAGNNVVGQAGVEIRASIDKISQEIESRIDQLKDAGKEVWKLVYADISKEIDDIMKFLKDYTNQVNKMIEDRIKQIDTALAQRLDQISDTITETIDKLDNVIQKTITNAKDAAVEVINEGEKSIITVMDNVVVNIVRMVIIIVLIILLVIVLVLAWKNILPKTLPAIIITSVFGAIIISGSLVFLLNNKVMAYIFGRKIELTQTEVAQDNSSKSYENFIDDVESGSSVAELKESGKIVINDLLIAKYVTIDPDIIKEINKKIETVNTLIYPPPKPNSDLKLGTTSKFYTKELQILKDTSIQLKLQPEVLYKTKERLQVNPELFKLNLKSQF
ncbi:MAG: hypothetical protein JXR70_12465 [Spirochaetales bacterium]|nr:hypothetical protein [Spirochaetales bacterium]